ncbi:aldehyde dehydrogenase [Leucobacter luti]|uniref:aldehyde dehydrogenase family protein n=1 Tax=Leucobacter luti TaxID=340320 RepID=UPI001C68E8E9|nr:aldehyde dehydrogenase family protein [Leucobacter luti]QYM77076.1 aldehyde dehydrogenase family protein [Leucobacter luti]
MAVSPTQVHAYIDGEWRDGSAARQRYTAALDGADLGDFAVCTPADVDLAVAAARAAQADWAAVPLLDKVDLFYRAYEICSAKNEPIAQAISAEMGKTIAESREEMVEYAWGHFRRAAEDMLRFRGQTLPNSETRTNTMRTQVAHYPLGVVGVISPFNFPVDIPAIGITYALIAGNTVVWKPSEACPGSTALYAEIFAEAGFPPGVFNFVPGCADAGERLVEHDDVNGIFFTGSTAVGRKISAKSGLKRLLLELGGNGPIIVHQDANIERAVEATITGCFYMAGQVCTAAERVLVHADVHDAFVARLLERTQELTLGDPLSESSDMGPLCNDATLCKVEAHIADARERGATIHQFHEQHGRLYPPTVLTGVTPEMRIAAEETFGPVAPVMVYHELDEALRIANETEFGLNAAAFTENIRDSWRFIDGLQHGTVLINETTNYWDQLAPFGGTKASGIGRELSTDALLSFTEKKTIVFNVA